MSSKSFSSCMLLMAWHRETNFLTSSPRTKGRIELDPIVVSKSFDLNTEMSFLFAFLYDLGAMFLGASPSIQPDRQKSTALSLIFRLNQSYLSLRALTKRSRMPRRQDLLILWQTSRGIVFTPKITWMVKAKMSNSPCSYVWVWVADRR